MPLALVHIRNSFRIRTYEKCVRKFFRIRTCEIIGLKLSWNHTLTKKPGGFPRILHLCFSHFPLPHTHSDEVHQQCAETLRYLRLIRPRRVGACGCNPAMRRAN